MSNPYTNEKDMNDYNRGKRDIMLEMAKADLEETASRIAILEEDLYEARRKKWELVNKMRLLEEGAAFECLDQNEAFYDSASINKFGAILIDTGSNFTDDSNVWIYRTDAGA